MHSGGRTCLLLSRDSMLLQHVNSVYPASKRLRQHLKHFFCFSQISCRRQIVNNRPTYRDILFIHLRGGAGCGVGEYANVAHQKCMYGYDVCVTAWWWFPCFLCSSSLFGRGVRTENRDTRQRERKWYIHEHLCRDMCENIDVDYIQIRNCTCDTMFHHTLCSIFICLMKTKHK